MIIVWWKSIPTQVIVKNRDVNNSSMFWMKDLKRQLTAVQCVVVKLTQTISCWFSKSTPVEVEGEDLQALATTKGKELEASIRTKN